MLFDPRRYLRMIDQEERNHEMRPCEGSPGANRAKCANPTNAAGPARLYHSASHDPDDNSGMRPSEGSARANRAKRANREAWNSTNSTFSTDPTLAPDPAALLTLLRERGPMSYGAAASALGWGGTRTWQAEAGLRASGRIAFDPQGRAALTARAGA